MNQIATDAIQWMGKIKCPEIASSFQRWSRITATTETICTTILNLPSSLASMVNPSDAAIERRPLTRNSRPITTIATHAGTRLGFNCTSTTKAAAIKSLSASGSSKIPMVVICPRLRARYPSMPSVIDAAINSAEASSSFSPFTLLKRALDKIQISKGMLKIRISVMELGRFTLRRCPAGSGKQSDYPPPRMGTQCTQISGQKKIAQEFLCEPLCSNGEKLLLGCRRHLVRLGLLGDDQILDLVVSRLRNDLLLHQLVLGAIRPPVNDFLGIGVANAGQFLQLIFRCGIDIQFFRVGL